MPWKEFIASHNGSLTHLLNVIAEKASKGNFDDLSEFLEYYKDKDVRKDIDRKWRDKANGKRMGQVISGKHEWLPTNLLPYMMSMAAGWEDVRWLIGMEILRTPCSALIYRGRIRKTPKPASSPEGRPSWAGFKKLQDGTTVSEILDFQGHVGCLYANDKSKGKVTARQVGMPTWHGHLRDIIYRRLNQSTNDLLGFSGEMASFVGNTIWNGSLAQLANFSDENTPKLEGIADKVACDYFSDRKGTRWGGCKTLREMAMYQSMLFANFNAVLKNQFLALTNSPGPRVAYNQLITTAIISDGGLPWDEEVPDESD